jgi:nicotinamidase-related amidase
MSRALFIIDVQNDFTEGGALGVQGGEAVAQGISKLLAQHKDAYDVIFASRDWHDPDNNNGGHFAGDEQRHLADRDGIDGGDGQDVDAGAREGELDPGQVIGLADGDQRSDRHRAS